MTLEFLFFANLVLLLRFRLLLADVVVSPRRWWKKCAIEVLLLLLFVPVTAASLGAVAASVIASVAAISWVSRAQDRNAAQLILGVLHLLALSFCFGPAYGPTLRPWLLDANARLGELSAFGPALLLLGQAAFLKLLFGLLLAANEANLLIRWVLGRLQLKPGTSVQAIDAKEYARGRVIGLLERCLIYFFVLSGQYGAVGFTLAAKGFTRFKELENRSFAEYVLIGTLLSSGISMLIAAAIRFL